MINFCTVCDNNYILKGLAMRQSLIETIGSDFTLHWLCIDEDIYTSLSKKSITNVILYKLKDFEQTDSELQQAKKNPPSKYGTQYENYCWTLTPYFVNYILRNHIENGDKLVYVDSDIYFYKSPQIILDVVGDNSIGLHTHRFPSRNRKNSNLVGWYNIGVVVFKKDKVGESASNLWKEWLLNIQNPYYEEYGTCGDQKYAELFEVLFPHNTCIFDQHSSISHLAPWCPGLDNKPIVFFHFSHFTFDLQKDIWSDSIEREWKPTRYEHIVPYYDSYYNTIKALSIKYDL